MQALNSERSALNHIRVFEAFAGYGSQAMALRRLAEDYPRFSFEVVGISEIDRYALQAYRAVHGNVTNYGDITCIDWGDVPDFDLLTYSFPCTDISSAGKQQGFTEGSGTRSSLLWECRKAILAKRPGWLLMENVKALVSEKFLPLFREWEQWLASIGYRNYTQVLNAKDYGVPQNRERVFMVSTLSDVPYFFPKPLGVKCCLGDRLEESVDGRYFLSEKMVDGFIHRNEVAKEKGNGFRFEPVDGSGIAAAVLTAAGSRADDNYVYACAVRGRGDGNRQMLETGGSVANAVTTVQKDLMVMQLAKKVADMATTARGEECGTNVTADGRIVTFRHDKKRSSVQEYKIDSFGSDGQSLISARPSLMYDECLRIRKLTERECFRLMDVEETDIDKIQAAGISRTQQYKMAGNSIVVAVLYHIFRKMFIQPECETKQLKLF